MFGLFGLDPSTMSDEELLQKQVDLHARIVYAGRFCGTDTIAGLQRILQAIETERAERAWRGAWNERQLHTPDVIESDPDLAMLGKDDKPEKQGKIVPQQKPRVTITRTARPVEDKTALSGDPKDLK